MLGRLALVVTALAPSLARADGLDAATIDKQLASCHASETGEDPLAAVGAIVRAEAIGKHPTSEALQVVGKKARAYVFFTGERCAVIPVVGKPAAFAKGDLGGAKVAYVLRTPNCNQMECPTVLTLKSAASTDDRALDALYVPRACPDGAELERFAAFPGRDSLKLGCWGSAGVDPDRVDYLIDTDKGRLVVVAEVAAGVGWVQPPDEKHPRPCQARVPGGIALVARGDKPTIDVTVPATDDEARAAGVELLSGGCDQTIATHREQYDPRTRVFVAIGKAKVTIARKLCKCR